MKQKIPHAAHAPLILNAATSSFHISTKICDANESRARRQRSEHIPTTIGAGTVCWFVSPMITRPTSAIRKNLVGRPSSSSSSRDYTLHRWNTRRKKIKPKSVFAERKKQFETRRQCERLIFILPFSVVVSAFDRKQSFQWKNSRNRTHHIPKHIISYCSARACVHVPQRKQTNKLQIINDTIAKK